MGPQVKVRGALLVLLALCWRRVLLRALFKFSLPKGSDIIQATFTSGLLAFYEHYLRNTPATLLVHKLRAAFVVIALQLIAPLTPPSMILFDSSSEFVLTWVVKMADCCRTAMEAMGVNKQVSDRIHKVLHSFVFMSVVTGALSIVIHEFPGGIPADYRNFLKPMTGLRAPLPSTLPVRWGSLISLIVGSILTLPRIFLITYGIIRPLTSGRFEPRRILTDTLRSSVWVALAAACSNLSAFSGSHLVRFLIGAAGLSTVWIERYPTRHALSCFTGSNVISAMVTTLATTFAPTPAIALSGDENAMAAAGLAARTVTSATGRPVVGPWSAAARAVHRAERQAMWPLRVAEVVSPLLSVISATAMPAASPITQALVRALGVGAIRNVNSAGVASVEVVVDVPVVPPSDGTRPRSRSRDGADPQVAPPSPAPLLPAATPPPGGDVPSPPPLGGVATPPHSARARGTAPHGAHGRAADAVGTPSSAAPGAWCGTPLGGAAGPSPAPLTASTNMYTASGGSLPVSIPPLPPAAASGAPAAPPPARQGSPAASPSPRAATPPPTAPLGHTLGHTPALALPAAGAHGGAVGRAAPRPRRSTESRETPPRAAAAILTATSLTNLSGLAHAPPTLPTPRTALCALGRRGDFAPTGRPSSAGGVSHPSTSGSTGADGATYAPANASAYSAAVGAARPLGGGWTGGPTPHAVIAAGALPLSPAASHLAHAGTYEFPLAHSEASRSWRRTPPTEPRRGSVARAATAAVPAAHDGAITTGPGLGVAHHNGYHDSTSPPRTALGTRRATLHADLAHHPVAALDPHPLAHPAHASPLPSAASPALLLPSTSPVLLPGAQHGAGTPASDARRGSSPASTPPPPLRGGATDDD